MSDTVSIIDHQNDLQSVIEVHDVESDNVSISEIFSHVVSPSPVVDRSAVHMPLSNVANLRSTITYICDIERLEHISYDSPHEHEDHRYGSAYMETMFLASGNPGRLYMPIDQFICKSEFVCVCYLEEAGGSSREEPINIRRFNIVNEDVRNLTGWQWAEEHRGYSYYPCCTAEEANHAQENHDVMNWLTTMKYHMIHLMQSLSDHNIGHIVEEIREIFFKYGGVEMNLTYTAAFFQSVVRDSISEEYILINVALVVLLHNKVGNDISGYLVLSLVKEFDKIFKNRVSAPRSELVNIVRTISHLFRFQVVECHLLFDMLLRLMRRNTCDDMELIRLIVRSVGEVMYYDRPAIIQHLHLTMRNISENITRPCARICLKSIMYHFDAVTSNDITRMILWNDQAPNRTCELLISQMSYTRHVTPHRICLESLMEDKGKERLWFLGSAWTGAPPGYVLPCGVCSSEGEYCPNLGSHIYTSIEVRRNVFCALLCARDASDAYRRIRMLHLSRLQSREIVQVVMECCLKESMYYKMYGYLLLTFCENDRNFHITLQRDLWHKFDGIQHLNANEYANMIMVLKQLLTSGVLNLTIFKFVTLDWNTKPVVPLVAQVLLDILVGDIDCCSRVFSWVNRPMRFNFFGARLHQFIQQVVKKRLPKKDSRMLLLLERINRFFPAA